MEEPKQNKTKDTQKTRLTGLDFKGRAGLKKFKSESDSHVHSRYIPNGMSKLSGRAGALGESSAAIIATHRNC